MAEFARQHRQRDEDDHRRKDDVHGALARREPAAARAPTVLPATPPATNMPAKSQSINPPRA